MLKDFCQPTLATAFTPHVLPETEVRHGTIARAPLTATLSLLRFAREVNDRER